MEVKLQKNLSKMQEDEIKLKLKNAGLEDVRVFQGWNNDLGYYTLTIITKNKELSKDKVRSILKPYVGSLEEYDVAEVRVNKTLSSSTLSHLKERFPLAEVKFENSTLKIRAIELDVAQLRRALQSYLGEEINLKMKYKNIRLNTVGPTLGATLLRQGIKALFIAFILMGIVVSVSFRTFIPSIAVMSAAICDVLIALSGMSILGIELSPASLAALLMLIGYSVDSDILLTARVLRGGRIEVNHRIDDAMKTGLTMTLTTLAALSVIYVVSTFLTHIPTLQAISSVLILGLLADITTTWFMNAGILKWYLESGGRR